MKVLSDNMVKIQIAAEHGVTIKNGQGEIIKLPSNDGTRTEDCVKCYLAKSYGFYWSSASAQEILTVNDKPFDDWFERLPLKIF